jgi:ribose transport system substrate-binding protein
MGKASSKLFEVLNAAAAIFVVASFLVVPQPSVSQSFDRLRGAAKPVKAKRPYRIGFATVHFVDNYWMGLTYGIQDEGKLSGANLVSVLSAGGYGNLSQQISNIETLASNKLDGIIVAGVTYDGLDRIIKRVTDTGIKVVVAGTPVNAKTVTVGVLESEVRVGEQMGEYICAHDPGAKVIAIPGPQGSEWNRARLDGFEAAGKRCNLHVLGGIFQGQMNLEDGQKQAGDMLVKYPDAKYIWAVAGLLGDGAAAAVKKAGRRDVKVVSSAFAQLTMQMLKEGYMATTVSEPAVLIGRLAMQDMIRALNGDPLPKTGTSSLPYPVTFSPTVVVEAKDAATYRLSQYDWPPPDWKNPFAQ